MSEVPDSTSPAPPPEWFALVIADMVEQELTVTIWMEPMTNHKYNSKPSSERVGCEYRQRSSLKTAKSSRKGDKTADQLLEDTRSEEQKHQDDEREAQERQERIEERQDALRLVEPIKEELINLVDILRSDSRNPTTPITWVYRIMPARGTFHLSLSYRATDAARYGNGEDMRVFARIDEAMGRPTSPEHPTLATSIPYRSLVDTYVPFFPPSPQPAPPRPPLVTEGYMGKNHPAFGRAWTIRNLPSQQASNHQP